MLADVHAPFTMAEHWNWNVFPVQAPVPCEKKVAELEKEIQELKSTISSQNLYIQELHRTQSQQLENLPNLHLGTENQYRGRAAPLAGG